MSDESPFEMSSSSSSSPADCLYGITLTREISRYDVPGRAQAWRMMITVSDWYNVDPNILVYKRSLPDSITGDVSDTFIAVASPVDLNEYPAGAPNEGQDPPFYRTAEADLISRSQSLLESTWELVKADRDELIRSLVGICELELAEVSVGGYFPEAEEPVVPTVPTETSSSAAPVCPIDAYTKLKVNVSNDPDFPVDTELTQVAGPSEYPTCAYQWTVDGAVTGKTLLVTTSMVNHTYAFVYDGVQLAAGGLADGYKALISYTRGLGDEYTLQVEGVL